MRIKFGTEGWRGVIADDFTVENVRIVAAATARYLLEAQPPGKRAVVVGYDCRMMSELFAQACAETLNSFGFDVLLNDKPTATPALSAGILAYEAQGGCVFTASHNPGIFHGLKFKPYYGGAAITEITDAIERQLYVAEPSGSAEGRVEVVDFLPPYFERLKRLVDVDRIRHSGLRLATDAMYGAGAGNFRRLLPEMDILSIREERNPIFPGIHPEPILEMLGPLVEATKGRDIGIAFDGDADRLAAIDEKGNFVDSHRIFAVTFKHLRERRGEEGDVAKTLTTTRMIDRLASRYGVRCHVTPVGFKHIVEKMLEGNILMGGEESGGMGVTRNLPERDAMAIALLLMEAMVMSGKPLSALVEEVFELVGPHWYHRIDAQFQRSEMPVLKELVAGLSVSEVCGLGVRETDKMDGTLFELENGGFLMLRASGTEPVVRIYAEARSPEIAAALTAEGEKLLRRALG